ncbi:MULTISPECIES: hypothetical protein [unclassified Corallococcus]|uniref:hypothetical protein n=1 Tax=unclassified Corallococcus TaxID=2685029 RepID=UPI001A8E56C8|nr:MULTISPECIES: hypothetical protein [unclassified Corallococcus]MBN9688532.1 hypothetical protein [Corallococcus sp. NCSPR001]WAS87666.1 hypothetical protein O0N60_11985 [Corallococcus sp. NCRR]
MISPTSSLTDIAFAVCTALERNGFQAVLTGGSAATYYAPDAYQSGDLDFVITVKGTGGEAALAALGFIRKGDFYRHPRSHFLLEFPSGPLAVGDDLIRSWSTARRDDEVLHVLSPTDSCRDRLASFLFWNDFSGLEQALAVFHARSKEVDLNVIEDWCRRERHSQKFGLFASRIGAAK